jgi:hypothetical protein
MYCVLFAITQNLSLKVISRFVFEVEMQCVMCVGKADHLNVIWLYFRLERLQIVKNFEFKLNACSFLY